MPLRHDWPHFLIDLISQISKRTILRHFKSIFQITVRFHTRQQLAVYDRFGRLLHGSEILAKDVLEYIVFEKHLSNMYGTWRIHDKIIPDWTPPKDPSKLTRVKPEPEPEIVKVEEEVQPAIADK